MRSSNCSKGSRRACPVDGIEVSHVVRDEDLFAWRLPHSPSEARVIFVKGSAQALSPGWRRATLQRCDQAGYHGFTELDQRRQLGWISVLRFEPCAQGTSGGFTLGNGQGLRLRKRGTGEKCGNHTNQGQGHDCIRVGQVALRGASGAQSRPTRVTDSSFGMSMVPPHDGSACVFMRKT